MSYLILLLGVLTYATVGAGLVVGRANELVMKYDADDEPAWQLLVKFVLTWPWWAFKS